MTSYKTAICARFVSQGRYYFLPYFSSPNDWGGGENLFVTHSLASRCLFRGMNDHYLWEYCSVSRLRPRCPPTSPCEVLNIFISYCASQSTPHSFPARP